MEPTRPILSFPSWMLHNVEVEREIDSWNLKLWMQDQGFHFSERGSYKIEDMEQPGYFIATITMGKPHGHHLYFTSYEDAQHAISLMGGTYNLLPIDSSPLKNTGIGGNFTLKDLMGIMGDPLPDTVKDILTDLRHRGINYFSNYYYMTHDWKRKLGRQCAWPEDFVYKCPTRDHDELASWEEHRWLMNVCGTGGFEYHGRGVEFWDKHHATLYRARWGEDPLHEITKKALKPKWNSFVKELQPIDRGW